MDMDTERPRRARDTFLEWLGVVLFLLVVAGLIIWGIVGYEPFMVWLTDDPIGTSWVWLQSREWSRLRWVVYGLVFLINLGWLADWRLRQVVDRTIRQALREEREREDRRRENE